MRDRENLMKTRIPRWLILGLAVLPAIGCVERRFVITTDPEVAIVECKGRSPLPTISAAPADLQFTYYVTYAITAQKEGYEMAVHREKVKAPWYEYPGLDFISENLIP